jgi:hypothetical protein
MQRATGLHWRTMRRDRDWAAAQGLLDQPCPPVEALHQLMVTTLELPPPPTVSAVEPYREVVTALHASGVASTAIWQWWRARGYVGSLASLSRLVHRLEPYRPSPTGRVEREPGSAAHVDVGYAGYRVEPLTGALRKTWACVRRLAESRHQDCGVCLRSVAADLDSAPGPCVQLCGWGAPPGGARPPQRGDGQGLVGRPAGPEPLVGMG